MAITIEDKIKIKRMQECNITQSQISRALGIPTSTLSDYLLGVTHKKTRYAWQVDPELISECDRVVGVIPDTHAPFTHPDAIKFLTNTFESRGVNTIVHIGDVIELHAASRFITEQEALNYKDELQLAREYLKGFSSIFPYITVTWGNHDKINQRKAKEYGIDLQSLKPMNQYLELPNTWRWVDKAIIDGVRYQHKGKGGFLGAINNTKDFGMSSVSGHSHVFGNVTYRKTEANGMMFGMDVGCLINKETYASNYAAEYTNELTFGCGVVYDSTHAEFVPLT